MFNKIKYESALVTFTEIPDEITLCLNITGCPCHCRDCFEPWLADDTGDQLEAAVLEALIDSHSHISCVCFMGGDRYYNDIAELIGHCRQKFPHLKWALYSGCNEMQSSLKPLLHYYKIGPYIPEKGPLNKKTTNQKLFKRVNNEWVDITYRFQQEKV